MESNSDTLCGSLLYSVYRLTLIPVFQAVLWHCFEGQCHYERLLLLEEVAVLQFSGSPDYGGHTESAEVGLFVPHCRAMNEITVHHSCSCFIVLLLFLFLPVRHLLSSASQMVPICCQPSSTSAIPGYHNAAQVCHGAKCVPVSENVFSCPFSFSARHKFTLGRSRFAVASRRRS